MQNWSLTDASDLATIIGAAVGVVTLIIGSWRYIDVRNRELRWKRTEFLFEQATYLDQDNEINRVIAILAGYDADKNVEDIFDIDGTYVDGVEHLYKQGFEKLFNLLDRLAYANIGLDVVDIKELCNFSWYYNSIVKHNRVVKFCEKNGFKDVIEMAQKV